MYVNINIVMTSCQAESELKWKQSGLELSIMFLISSSQHWHNILVIFFIIFYTNNSEDDDDDVLTNESTCESSDGGHRREPLRSRLSTGFSNNDRQIG